MKYKIVLFCLLSMSLFWACEDSVSNAGMGIMPDQDKLGIYTDTIYLDASTIKLDSIYAKTVDGMLGEFYDPTYGALKSSYLCQFYAPSKDVFMDSIIDNKIDSIVLKIYYTSYLGDSLAPMEATVYPITKALDKSYYTNMSPSKYYDPNTVWGRQAYTARNMNISDSINNDYIGKELSIRLPDDLATKFYNEWLKPAPNAYSSLDNFTKFFPGLYITTTFGTGNIIYVEGTNIVMYYNRLYTTVDSKGNDSTYTALRYTHFNVTKEIIQLNSYKSSHDDKLLQPSDDKAYVKTPAGIFTKVTIPIPDIINKMGKKKFTNAKFSLSFSPKDDWEYAIDCPDKLLLINPDSVITFFENKQVANFKTSYTSTIYKDKTTGKVLSYVCNFGNISAVIQNAIQEKPDKNLELLVIPVTTLSSGATDYTTSHYLKPSGITFKKDRENLKLSIVTTDMNVGQLK